jgi:hypothetical protein
MPFEACGIVDDLILTLKEQPRRWKVKADQVFFNRLA